MSLLWPWPVTAFTSALPPGFTSNVPGLAALTTASPTAHLALALFLISQPDKSLPLNGSTGGSAREREPEQRRSSVERRRSFIVWQGANGRTSSQVTSFQQPCRERHDGQG